MLRATRYGRPWMAWAFRRKFGQSAWTFAQRPIRLAAATAVAGLLLGNAVLVLEVTRHNAGPVRQETTSREAPALQPEAIDLRSALEAVEAEIRADVGRLTVRYQETSDRRSRSQAARAGGGAELGSQADGSGTAPASGASSIGSSSTESDTGAGVESSTSSGGSSSGTSDDSSSGSSGGSSGGSTTSGTGGGGGGGGGDTSGSGDVSGSGGSGGGGGG